MTCRQHPGPCCCIRSMVEPATLVQLSIIGALVGARGAAPLPRTLRMMMYAFGEGSGTSTKRAAYDLIRALRAERE